MTDDDPLEKQIRDVRNLLAEPLALCAWGGCAARFDPEKPAPEGWIALSISSSTDPPVCVRTAVLCPKHAKELDGTLKGISGRLGDIVAEESDYNA
jgi:hypothetical protein